MKISDAEWIVMNALWDGHPATAREILDRIGEETGWAYTTVKTMLDRLVEKDVVSVRRDGNVGRYRPRWSRARARKSAVRSLIDRAFDGAVGSFLHHLVAEEKLSPRDRARLSELLAEEEGEKES